MKFITKIITLLFLVVNCTFSHAQIPDGSIAPDFTVVDILGETHHLYTYLNEGKTVIIEIAATWCNPCWSYVQVGSLEASHQILGPDGLDNTVVLFVEGEPQNGIDQLHGETGSSGNPYADLTHGNWVKSINYPIIDDHNIANLYEISYYPTIFKICPIDKTVTELDQIPVRSILDEVLNTDCMTPMVDNDLAILRYIGTPSICDNTSFNAPLEIINLGKNMSNQTIIEIFSDSELLISDTIAELLPSFHRKVVKLGDIELNNATHLNFRLHTAIDDNLNNNLLDQEFELAPEVIGETIELTIHTDAYGFETYWEIRNIDGLVFYSGGNTEVGIDNGGPPYINAAYAAGTYESLSTHQYSINLPVDDCYELVLVDDYGDGICCEYGDGFYEIKDGSGNIVISGGRFSDYMIHPFSIEGNTTSINNTVPLPIKCYPNPASDFITLEQIPTNGEQLTLRVYNLLGQPVLNQVVNSNTMTLSTKDYPKGTYLVYLLSKNGTVIYTEKIITQ